MVEMSELAQTLKEHTNSIVNSVKDSAKNEQVKGAGLVRKEIHDNADVIRACLEKKATGLLQSLLAKLKQCIVSKK